MCTNIIIDETAVWANNKSLEKQFISDLCNLNIIEKDKLLFKIQIVMYINLWSLFLPTILKR